MGIHRLHFSIVIKSEKSKIWKTLWDEDSYRDWVSVFYEGSYAVTDNWEEGSKVLFLNPGENGIYSKIEKHVPNRIMKFKHLGNVVKGIEQPIDSETKKWSGTIEVYTLSDGDDGLKLTVEIDVLDEHLDYMKATFPKALERIKMNCSK